MSSKKQFVQGFTPWSVFKLIGLGDAGEKAAKGAVKAASVLSAGSLTEYLKDCRVEPLTIVENTLQFQDITPKILSANLDEFTAWYLQAASRLLNQDIDSARVMRVLGALSTSHDVEDALRLVAHESTYQFALPDYNEEVDCDMVYDFFKDKDDIFTAESSAKGGAGYAVSKNDIIPDAAPLCVGKLINVRAGGVNMPVQVRLQTKVASSALIRDIFEANYENVDFKHRVRLWRFGEITTRELITGADILSRQDRIRLNDKNGDIYSVIGNNASDLAYYGISGNVPINRAAGIMVITAQTARTLERAIGGRLDNFQSRQKYFRNTATTMMSIVDLEDGMVTTYYRGFSGDYTHTFKHYEGKGGGNNNGNLEPLIKALLSGGSLK